jgi:putative acetyltransferase
MKMRPIRPEDNAAVAHVIRTVMPEFSCVGEGFSINDPEVADMAGTYLTEGSNFFVVELAGANEVGVYAERNRSTGAGEVEKARVVGCGGFAPLAGGDGSVCELRKMYILKEGRGYGGGKMIMEACLEGARQAGYTHMYLETVTAMKTAAAVYQKYGFDYLDGPMGETGHGGCDLFMVREL